MKIEDYIGTPEEKPLDSYSADGGFAGIFRTFACVGDSLSSGEFEVVHPLTGNKMFLDRFDYSWGQYVARFSGATAYNFSRGGMTAKEYNETFGNAMGYFRPELAADAYIVALGVNDLLGRKIELGEMSDIKEDWRENADTFTGHYAAIIQRYKKLRPEAKFFLLNFPRAQGSDAERNAIADAHAARVAEIAAFFPGTYVIDLRTYGPDFDADFIKKFYLAGHLNPAGYLFVGRMVVSYIDYIVRHNFEDFREVGLNGIEYARADGTKKLLL